MLDGNYSCHIVKGTPGHGLVIKQMPVGETLSSMMAGIIRADSICALCVSDNDKYEFNGCQIIDAKTYSLVSRLAELRGYSGLDKLVYMGLVLVKLDDTRDIMSKCKGFIAPTEHNRTIDYLSKVLCAVGIQAESPALVKRMLDLINDRFEITNPNLIDSVISAYNQL